MSKKKQKSAKSHLRIGQYNGQPKIFNNNRIVLRDLPIQGDNNISFSATLVEQFRWIDEENKESIMFDVFHPSTTLQIVDDDKTPIQLGLRAEEMPPELGTVHLH